MKSVFSLIFLRLLSILPLSILHGIGGLAGLCISIFPTSKRRRVTLINLKLCLPELDSPHIKQLMRASLMETGKLLAEYPVLWFRSKTRVLSLIRGVSGESLLNEAINSGNGVIISAPHVGNWEIVGMYIAPRHPMICLYRTQRQAWVDDMLIKVRDRFDIRLAPTDAGGIKQLLKALRQKQVVGILPDQNPGQGAGVFVPMFGITTYSPVLLSRLANKTGARVIFAYAERLPWGRGFHLHFLPAPAGVDASDPEQAATRVNQGIEDCIRRLPQQYWWSYKRFRRRPPGEPPIY